MEAAEVLARVRVFPDWPKLGVRFLDVGSLTESPELFRWTVSGLSAIARREGVEALLAVDARGFLWGGAVAAEIGLPVVLARKPGKLPGEPVCASYEYEYASGSVCVQRGAPLRGKRVMVVDDVLATGGTLKALEGLLREEFGVSDVVLAVVLEIGGLAGRTRLEREGTKVCSLMCS